MKTLAKTLISSLTPALLLGLSGCSIHVHGKSEAQTGDGKTAGGEHAQKPKPDPKVVRVSPKPAPAPNKPTPTPAPAPVASGNVDAGGALSGGKAPTGNDKPKPSIDTGAISGGVKPTNPAPIDTSGVSGGVKPGGVDTSAVSGGVKPSKPVDTSGVSGGVKPGGVDTSGAVSGGAAVPVKKPDAPVDNSQVVGGGSVKPPKPIDTTGAIAGGVKVNTRSPESIAAEKLAAEGKRERGDRDLPNGSVATGEKKPPTPAPVTKDKGSNEKPGLEMPKPSAITTGGSAVAMVPEHGEGKGQLRTPVAVNSVSCSLPVSEIKQGARFKVKGQGFATGLKVTVGGIGTKVTSTKATQIDAQLPAELQNGGDVVVELGNVIANCGKLTISPKK